MNKTIRKISFQLHLWLGIISGLILFIVCITGCLYAFKDEITNLTQPWRFVTPSNKPTLPPSQIIALSNLAYQTTTKPASITFGAEKDAVSIDYYEPNGNYLTVYINPYHGTVIHKIIRTPNEFNFFNFVIKGHKSLWLPATIGKPLVGYGVLMFVVVLITGLILWWPKKWNKKSIKRLSTIKWKASFKRLNFDLHNVPGGYAAILLLILSFTGLIRNMEWFSESIYYLTSGGKHLIPYSLPLSDPSQSKQNIALPIDKLYQSLKNTEPLGETYYLSLPKDADDVIRVSVEHKKGSYYRTDNLFFDQYTLKQLSGSGPYAGKYTEVTVADKLRRMNLDIHDGRIIGITGKIMMFLASLVGASLPITGILIWFRKQK
ncbi:sulfite reductase [Macellibacteroides sp. HH-ZS]|nr:sulfite reductase [Macellibacteroides sp. HH-ZS]